MAYTHGVAVADYDRDGFPDLLITGWNRVMLLHNEPNPAGGTVFRFTLAAVSRGDQRYGD